jgi:hypothetical protein
METNMINLIKNEEKKMTELYNINIQVKKTKVGALFNTISQANLIT